MSIFNKIFGDSDKGSQLTTINWHHLTEIKQLDALIVTSFEKPAFIFKHSTRCAISRMALKQLEGSYNISEEEADAYFLDLLEYRNISNQIASNLNVVHQSPQIILVNNGECIYTASHSDIDAQELKDKIGEIPNKR